MTIEL